MKRTKLYLVVMLFFLPMIASWVLYHYHDYFQLKTTNHGTLIEPPVNEPSFQKEKIWRIIYVNSGSCDVLCQKRNFMLHQVQKALGKDSERVKILLADKPFNQMQSGKIYLVDPAANIFMYYPDSTDPMNILKDLKKVLEVSQIG